MLPASLYPPASLNFPSNPSFSYGPYWEEAYHGTCLSPPGETTCSIWDEKQPSCSVFSITLQCQANRPHRQRQLSYQCCWTEHVKLPLPLFLKILILRFSSHSSQLPEAVKSFYRGLSSNFEVWSVRFTLLTNFCFVSITWSLWQSAEILTGNDINTNYSIKAELEIYSSLHNNSRSSFSDITLLWYPF